MSFKSDILDSAANAAAKQASRDKDARRLAAGEVSREELAVENNFFSALPIQRMKIRSVGGVRVRPPQKSPPVSSDPQDGSQS